MRRVLPEIFSTFFSTAFLAAFLAACLLACGTPAHAAPRQPHGAMASAQPAETVSARLPVAVADGDACRAAIQTSEKAFNLPARLLDAIGLVESGRTDPRNGRTVPWPWTINVAGTGYFFATKSEAIAAVQSAQAGGTRSIDVGCMQINLMHHPDAFAALDEAFDPPANAHYAALFLQRLHAATGTWSAAAAAYHSMTPELGADYIRRVAAFWPMAESFGLSAAAPPPIAPVALVDPMHVMTPEFRARLLRDAAERAARDAQMGLVPAQMGHPAIVPAAHRLAAPGSATPRLHASSAAVTAWR